MTTDNNAGEPGRGIGLLQYLPNSLTILRLLLAVPVGILILREEFAGALAVGFVAGLSDALDGYFARKLQAFSKLGAALDPIADKLLITVSFLSFASVGLIPWYLAITVIARDLIIMVGACSYHWLIGNLEFSPTLLSKANMFVQIAFCVLVLLAQVASGIPQVMLEIGQWLVIFMALCSGAHYVALWTGKAMRAHRESGGS
jgi:cardiolipin synthase